MSDPTPAPEDRERAERYLEKYIAGYVASLDSSPSVDALAAEFAAVREAERKRCAAVARAWMLLSDAIVGAEDFTYNAACERVAAEIIKDVQ